MKANYWQKGVSIDYKNTTDAKIEAESVVDLGTRIAIAGTDILPGETGSLITEGVFIFKKTTASAVIALGAAVYYDGTGITTSASGESANTPVGWAVKASSATETDVYVKLDTIPDGVGASSADIETALADYYTKEEVNALIPAAENDDNP